MLVALIDRQVHNPVDLAQPSTGLDQLTLDLSAEDNVLEAHNDLVEEVFEVGPPVETPKLARSDVALDDALRPF